MENQESQEVARSLIAPAVAIGAGWAVKQAMSKGYTAKTGQTPPKAADRDVPLMRVLLWAAATAAAVAMVDIAVNRYLVKH